jgi:MFS family permease
MLLTQNPELLGLIGAATALLGPLWNVVMMQYELTIVPEELRGRVGGAVQTVVSGTLPLGSLGAGFLLASVGPRRSLLALAGVMAVVALVGTLSPAIRKAPTPPSATPQPEGEER